MTKNIFLIKKIDYNVILLTIFIIPYFSSPLFGDFRGCPPRSDVSPKSWTQLLRIYESL